MEYMEGYQIRAQLPLNEKHVKIWRLKFSEKKTLKQIRKELRIGTYTINKAMKQLKHDYPGLAERLIKGEVC